MLLFLTGACVSTREFSGVQDQLTDCEDEQVVLKKEVRELRVSTNELKGNNKRLQEKMATAKQENEQLRRDYTVLSGKANRLTRDNAALEEQQELLKQGSSKEISQLLTDLQSAQTDLQGREDRLRGAQSELEQRNARLMELENILKRKDEAVKALKKKVMNALTGFNNNGLTVHEKNGKVYVSLDEKLLFKTGKYDVDPKGKQALSNLAGVLAKNPDINVMVEGHTDDVPLRGTGTLKDNWDLSVMRATAVTKILLRNKHISPQRITSAGRSKYVPIDGKKTAYARQKNRRTEIILTPRLDELFKLLEVN